MTIHTNKQVNQQFREVSDDLRNQVDMLAHGLGKAFKAIAIDGKSAEDSLRKLALSLSDSILRSATKQLFSQFSGSFSQKNTFFNGGAAGEFTNFLPGISPFEPRTNRAPFSVNMTVNAQDANSFRRSESQIAALLAKSVSRGQRSL